MMPTINLKDDPRRLGGLGLAIITPLGEDGSPDLEALSALAKACSAGGVEVFYPLGTTGEGALLSDGERRRVLRCVREAVPDRVVVAGAGAISTADTVAQTTLAREEGADGVLVVTPPYVKPSVNGLLAHYRAVARVGLPVVAYVVPGRTSLPVAAAVQARILEIDGILAVKEASGNLTLLAQVAQAADRLGKLVLVGDDALTLPGMAVGAHGLISVVAQVIPGSMSALVKAMKGGRVAAARAIHRRFLELMEAMFWESNPLPVKQALALRGQCRPAWKLPLLAPEEGTTARLRALLGSLEILDAPYPGDDPDRAGAGR